MYYNSIFMCYFDEYITLWNFNDAKLLILLVIFKFTFDNFYICE